MEIIYRIAIIASIVCALICIVNKDYAQASVCIGLTILNEFWLYTEYTSKQK